MGSEMCIRDSDSCQRYNASLLTEPARIEEARAPIESIGCDLFDCGGRQFIVLVDRYSGYIFVQQLRSTTTAPSSKSLVTQGLIELTEGPSFVSSLMLGAKASSSNMN